MVPPTAAESIAAAKNFIEFIFFSLCCANNCLLTKRIMFLNERVAVSLLNSFVWY
jgi:hypothetical protein